MSGKHEVTGCFAVALVVPFALVVMLGTALALGGVR